MDPPPLFRQVNTKPSRAQARKAAKQQTQQAAYTLATEESSHMINHRQVELDQLSPLLEQWHLKIQEIQADGHCLFSAILHQLKVRTLECELQVSQVRHLTADILQREKEQWSPFYEGDYDEHVHFIRNTAQWGGSLELNAMAEAFKVFILVFQAKSNSPLLISPLQFQQEMESKAILPPFSKVALPLPCLSIVFREHAWALGAHYDSLIDF